MPDLNQILDSRKCYFINENFMLISDANLEKMIGDLENCGYFMTYFIQKKTITTMNLNKETTHLMDTPNAGGRFLNLTLNEKNERLLTLRSYINPLS